MKHPVIASVPWLLLQGCASTYATHPPVPPAFAEQVPAPPRSGVTLAWEPGHFDWNGAGYVKVPGRWVNRAGHGTLWQDGYWRESDRPPAWVPGHWL